MIRTTKAGSDAVGETFLVSPAVVVLLVLLLGATIYLWRARYIRSRTAYMLMAVLVIVLLLFGLWTYLHPLADAA